MPTTVRNRRRFDARPDRIDLRDLQYRAPLRSLPDSYPDDDFIKEHFGTYTSSLVLDQGREGACTGYGLAAMVNYLRWRRALADGDAPEVESVSPRMLYHLARIYDEWPGEDYSGSSCRGAMKGWHHHGVCLRKYWQRKPAPWWQRNAATNPLGAYYRINKDSIVDMQAAIHEVGAIYASAAVHEGWFLDEWDELPIIEFSDEESGGHAFCFIGYTPEGFIVQNSWGRKWGLNGFAIMTYEDWVENGSDAWVAAMGAPMAVEVTARTRSFTSLEELTSSSRAEASGRVSVGSGAEPVSPTAPWSEDWAYQHTIVLGNEGRPLNRFLDRTTARDAVKEVVELIPVEHLSKWRKPRVAIYAHGGLNDEEAGVRRVQVMAPYFFANEIYPIFVAWRTGFMESIVSVLEDNVLGIFRTRDEGLLDRIKDRFREAKDRAVEVACKHLLVKAVWSEMKENAEMAARAGGGMSLLAASLDRLRKMPEVRGLEIHLVGHSAGSILLGHLLDRFRSRRLKAKTCSLWAPACTVEFAVDRYGKANGARTLSWSDVHVDLLSDERERADSVGPYGKSLLYLVSRALQQFHKTPLLGMHAVLQPERDDKDLWHDSSMADIHKWRRAADCADVHVHGADRQFVSDGSELIPLAHGSFDNDVAVVRSMLRRIRGALRVDVEKLKF